MEKVKIFSMYLAHLEFRKMIKSQKRLVRETSNNCVFQST